jgi:hypothetical protein
MVQGAQSALIFANAAAKLFRAPSAESKEARWKIVLELDS